MMKDINKNIEINANKNIKINANIKINIFLYLYLYLVLLAPLFFPCGICAADSVEVSTAVTAARTSGEPFSEIAGASFYLAQLNCMITDISGKFRMGNGFIEAAGIKFKIFSSEFEARGIVARGSNEHNFRVTSDALKIEDIKKIFPVLAAFDVIAELKLDCLVKGKADSPIIDVKIESDSAVFDLSRFKSELKKIKTGKVKLNVLSANHKYEIKNFSFGVMEGFAVLSGIYDSQKTSEAFLNFKADKINAALLSSYFSAYDKKVSGILSADFKIKNAASFKNFTAAGKLSFLNGVLKDFDFLKKIGEKLKTPIEKLNYSYIGGDIQASAGGAKISFKDFSLNSDIIKLKADGDIDENSMIEAKVFAEAEGAFLANKIGNKKFSAFLQKAVSAVKLNFILSGPAANPKIDLDIK